jgi:c-di-GMP-binding flagellar brake protein YcgR
MERRTNERYRIWFPMTVVTDDGEEGTAITYDVSAAGLLMACPGKLDVGAHVTLRFRVGADDPDQRAIGARVVRVEDNAPDEEGPWRHRMAVEFDTPQPDLQGVLEAHADD